MKNTAEWYENRRNELVSMLDEALSLNIPEKYDAELRNTAKKCKENSFEIALVGEFQGGKSTTFNALCDGRDISPRGLGGGGIKTSAAAISAQNIAGDETKDGLPEWAEVTFKQPVALILGMASVLRPVLVGDKELDLVKDEETKSKLFSDVGFCELIKIDDTSHRAALARAIDNLWRRWEQDKASLDDDTLDQLRIATLQLKFYGTPEYERMAQKTILPISDFQKLVAFPKDWAVRWLKGKDADFTLEEIAFVFIESVLVRLHSKNLARLGCRITDCPGLFANSYDTAVAKRVIQNADAIWYLIGGEKQIGEKDLEIIKTIKNMGMLAKTDATCNLKGPHEQKISEVMETTKAILKSKDYSLEIIPYNARLAFLAMQGNLILNHAENFSALDLDNMRVDAKDKTGEAKAEEMWRKMVSRLGSSTELEALEEIEELDNNAVSTVRKESYFDDIIKKLEDEVIGKKAHSILIDKGSNRAAAALADYEGVLKITEDAAAAKEEEWKAKVGEAEKKLRDYVTRAKEIIEDSPIVATKEFLAKEIAEEFICKVFDNDFINLISDEIAFTFQTVQTRFVWTTNGVLEEVKNRITPFLEASFKDSFVKTRGLMNEFNTFENLRTYSRSMVRSIHLLWKDRKLDEEGLFHGIELPEINNDDFSFGSEFINDKIFSENAALSEIADKIRVGILEGVLIVLEAVILALPKLLINIGVGIAAWLGWLQNQNNAQLQKGAQQNLRNSSQKLVPEIRKELKEVINNVDFRRRIQAPLVKSSLDSIERLICNFNCLLGALESDFRDTRCKPVEDSFRKAQAERQRIADEANRIRTMQIQPLRERINAFEKSVEAELA